MSLEKSKGPNISRQDPWATDPLSRKKEGEILANLISTLGDAPFVISLKGGWGTGKSVFLERLGHHLEIKHKIPIVRIDAWKSDYVDDPLIAMTAALSDRLIEISGKTSTSVNTVITGLAKSASKIVLPITVLAAGLIIPGGGKAVEIASALPSLAENLLEWDRSRKDAETEFRDNLSKAKDRLKSHLKSAEKSPVVVIIDELDRCRPDFSIKFLERIKHFFNVPGICFLIATDNQNLPQAVNTVYGAGVNGESYLRKFFDFEFNLPPPSLEDYAKHLFQTFPNADASVSMDVMRARLLEHGIPHDYESLLAERRENLDQAEYSIFFGHLTSNFKMQLRDALQAHTLLMAFVRSYPVGRIRLPLIDCYVSCLRFINPDAYRDLIGHEPNGISKKLANSL